MNVDAGPMSEYLFSRQLSLGLSSTLELASRVYIRLKFFFFHTEKKSEKVRLSPFHFLLQ